MLPLLESYSFTMCSFRTAAHSCHLFSLSHRGPTAVTEELNVNVSENVNKLELVKAYYRKLLKKFWSNFRFASGSFGRMRERLFSMVLAIVTVLLSDASS